MIAIRAKRWNNVAVFCHFCHGAREAFPLHKVFMLRKAELLQDRPVDPAEDKTSFHGRCRWFVHPGWDRVVLQHQGHTSAFYTTKQEVALFLLYLQALRYCNVPSSPYSAAEWREMYFTAWMYREEKEKETTLKDNRKKQSLWWVLTLIGGKTEHKHKHKHTPSMTSVAH